MCEGEREGEREFGGVVRVEGGVGVGRERSGGKRKRSLVRGRAAATARSETRTITELSMVLSWILSGRGRKVT